MKALLPVIALVTAGCTPAKYETFKQLAQGTYYNIVVRNPPADIAKKIDSTFAEIDLTFSMFNPESLTSRINRGETDSITPLFQQCFDIAKQVNIASDGYFDSTVAPLVDAWGFGGEGAKQACPNVDSLLAFVGMDKIRIENGHIIKTDPRVRLDFSSVAKGFTVDRLALMLEAAGVTDYMVWVGGEARVRGVNSTGREWRIGIDKPSFGLSSDGYEAAVHFSNRLPSIATSGNYRNWFVDDTGRTRVHIIDPKTGIPALGEILSVSIVAGECAVADAWATGIMAAGTVVEARRLLNGVPSGVEFYVIHSAADGGQAEFHSAGFPIVGDSPARPRAFIKNEPPKV
jgi:thiamine biosynthesis lipoprotein